MPQKTSKPNENLRALPSIDALLKTGTGAELGAVMGLEQLTNLARKVTDELRQEILAGRLIER